MWLRSGTGKNTHGISVGVSGHFIRPIIRVPDNRLNFRYNGYFDSSGGYVAQRTLWEMQEETGAAKRCARTDDCANC
jgi:hypothetical protein